MIGPTPAGFPGRPPDGVGQGDSPPSSGVLNPYIPNNKVAWRAACLLGGEIAAATIYNSADGDHTVRGRTRRDPPGGPGTRCL